MGFTYIPNKNIYIHMATSFVFDGEYLLIATNDEIKNKFFNSTGYVLDDFTIGMMRARVKDGQTIYS